LETSLANKGVVQSLGPFDTAADQ